MFLMAKKFNKDQLFDWIRPSVNLMKSIKGDDHAKVNVCRLKEHAKLKESILNAGTKPQTEFSRFKSNLKNIADLMKIDAPKAKNLYDFTYKVLNKELNKVVK